MTSMKKPGSAAGWSAGSALGKPLTEFSEAEAWFTGTKGEWRMNKQLGVAAWLDHLGVVTHIGFFAAGVEGRNKAWAGALPGDLTFDTSRADARKLFGAVESSGEAVTEGIFAGTAWDRWQFDDGSLVHITYDDGATAIRQVQLQAPPKPEIRSFELEVYADYNQFFVADRDNTCDTGTIWDAPDSSDRQIAVGEGLVAIGTKRYGTVPVTVAIYPEEPRLDLRGLDRVNECGIKITSSLVVGMFISNPEPTPIDIAPGFYGMRAIYTFQDQVDSDAVGNDRYTIELWPTAELLPLRYLKPNPPKQ
jgi:hypothetical protein